MLRKRSNRRLCIEIEGGVVDHNYDPKMFIKVKKDISIVEKYINDARSELLLVLPFLECFPFCLVAYIGILLITRLCIFGFSSHQLDNFSVLLEASVIPSTSLSLYHIDLN